VTTSYEHVAPALLRGEQRTVLLTLDDVDLDDRSLSVELHSDYYDDNGVRNERLAFVFDDTLVLTPPQPARGWRKGRPRQLVELHHRQRHRR
jgi:hypothetical protein